MIGYYNTNLKTFKIPDFMFKKIPDFCSLIDDLGANTGQLKFSPNFSF